MSVGTPVPSEPNKCLTDGCTSRTAQETVCQCSVFPGSMINPSCPYHGRYCRPCLKAQYLTRRELELLNMYGGE